MARSKRLTGFFAIAVVALVVATAIVPVMNVSASSSGDDAAPITAVKGADMETDAGTAYGETDLMSALSSLPWRADAFFGADRV